MIFALAIDDRTLMVFPDEAQAVAYCEGIDVEEGNWLFFNDNGKPLDAVFTTPNKHGSFAEPGRAKRWRVAPDSWVGHPA